MKGATRTVGAPEWARAFAAAPVGIAITAGPDDAYVYANEEFSCFADRPVEELLGRPLAETSRSVSAKGYRELAERVRRERAGATFREVRVVHELDGGEAYYDVRVEPLLDLGGAVEAVLLVVVDVTGRIEAQRRAETLAATQATVLEQMTNALVVVDPDGTITLENAAARSIAGAALVGRKLAELGDLLRASPVDEPGLADRPSIARALAGERVGPVEYRIVRPADGRPVWISYSIGPMRDARGEITGAIATVADVSTEHALRGAIAESEERLRRVYEAVGCGVLVRDRTGHIVFANEESARIFGVEQSALVGALHAPGIRRFAEDGAPMPTHSIPAQTALREKRIVRDVRSRLVRSDGTERWVRVDTVPIFGPDGEPEYAVTSFVDITARKHAEERLALSAREQAAVAELGRRALATTDLAALFAEATATVNELLGVDACRVLEHRPAEGTIVLRAGTLIGAETDAASIVDDPEASQAGYTLALGADVVANDLASEIRFAVYAPIVASGYRSTATVLIPGRDRPFGVLAVISRALEFGEDDVRFVRGVAHVLGEAIERIGAMERLRTNEERLRTVVENLPVALMVYDADGRVSLLAGSRSATRPDPEQRIGDSVFDINRRNPEGLNRIVRALRGEEVAEEVRRGDRSIEIRHQPVLGPDRQVSEVVGIALDITDRVQAKTELARKEAFVRAIFESVDTHIAVLDATGRIVDANPQWLEFGREAHGDLKDGVIGDDYLAHCHALGTDEAREVATGIEAVLRGERQRLAFEFPIDRGDERLWFQMHVQPMRSADGSVVVAHRDITERKRVETALEHQALHDTLTELPNRVLLRDRLRQAILAGRRRNTQVALLFIDLDRFKELNDTFGHQAGDVVLREVGERFINAVRASDTVARLGGDEFAVLIPLAADREEALMVARRVASSLEEPFVVEGETAFIEASVGIVLCPEHGEDVQTLMRRADVAMYAAKRSGSGIQLYEPEKDLHSPSAIGLAGDLRHAIERDELVLHYQPIVDLRTGRVVSVEALCRWKHPLRGVVAPGLFIPLAEETGFIKQIGLWTIGQALNAAARWNGDAPGLVVAVNLSMRNLRGNDLPRDIADLVERTGGDPTRLKIEITETAMMADAEHTLDVLGELQRMGIRLSIDDFGTGYSSLAYLQRLPADDIKVDRSFVLTMRKNSSDEAIVRSTVELAHSLGLRAIAEGVEDEPTLDRLRELGCDQAQGYAIGRPMGETQLREWLRSSPWGLAGPSGSPGGARRG